MAKFIFRQLFDSTCYGYTYLIGDKASRLALLIDPILEKVDRDLKIIDDLGLTLKYVINTHVHADHVTGSGEIKSRLNGKNNAVESVISRSSKATADRLVDDSETIECGSIKINVAYTPGHTNGCMSLIDHSEGRVFTGDTLFIRGCGRTDFQEGCSSKLYNSVHSRLFSLPDDYFVYPAHDYNGEYEEFFSGRMVSTIGEEKTLNPRLTKSEPEFIDIMAKLNLAYPKMMDLAVPRNLKCGF